MRCIRWFRGNIVVGYTLNGLIVSTTTGIGDNFPEMMIKKFQKKEGRLLRLQENKAYRSGDIIREVGSERECS